MLSLNKTTREITDEELRTRLFYIVGCLHFVAEEIEILGFREAALLTHRAIKLILPDDVSYVGG